MIVVAAPAPPARSASSLRSTQSRCEASRLARNGAFRQRARVRRCDREACAELVTCYSGRMLAVARRMLGCDEDAADAVQDAFVSALASIHRFQGRSQLHTWLHRILINACLMKLRSRKRRNDVSLDSLPPHFDERGLHAHASASSDDYALADLEKAELRARVRQCIDRLPDDFRTILILRDLEEFDTDETATRLGLSRAAVKTRLHRARQALRTLLEPAVVDAKRGAVPTPSGN